MSNNGTLLLEIIHLNYEILTFQRIVQTDFSDLLRCLGGEGPSRGNLDLYYFMLKDFVYIVYCNLLGYGNRKQQKSKNGHKDY